MHKVAFLVCDNGYGHLKRSLSIAYYLSNKGYSVDLYGDKNGFKIAKNINYVPINKPKLVPWKFSYDINYFLSKKSKNLDVLKRLPPLNSYDFVISDNIIESLIIRNDTILLSQFFWHEVIKDINEEYKNECKNLLKSFNPIIFGDKYFSMNYIKKSQKYIPTGLFSLMKSPNEIKHTLTEKKNLLITGGNTSQTIDILKKIILDIQNNFFNFFDKIFVDERLYPTNPIKKLEKFNYSKSHFEEITACICRPGLGILSDCIEHNIRTFAVYEENNFEMVHNTKIIENIGVGEELDYQNSLNLINYFNNKNLLEENHRMCNLVDFSGSADIYKFLKK